MDSLDQWHTHGSKCVCVCVTDVFKLDPDFLENEEKYKTIKRGESWTEEKACGHLSFLCKHSLVPYVQRSWMRAAVIQEGRMKAAVKTRMTKRARRKREKVSQARRVTPFNQNTASNGFGFKNKFRR